MRAAVMSLVVLVAGCGGAATPEPAPAPAPAVVVAPRDPMACMDRDSLRAAIPVSDEAYDRTRSTSVELDGRQGEELLMTLLERPEPDATTGTMRAWLLRCGETGLETVASAQWTFEDAPGVLETGIRAWSTAITAADPFRPLVVQIASGRGGARWRRAHVYVLEGATLREVLACLTYYDADVTIDPQPDLEGTVRDLPDREPGLDIERHARRGGWVRAQYAWDGARLVPRTGDLCAEDDPAPRDAPTTPLRNP